MVSVVIVNDDLCEGQRQVRKLEARLERLERDGVDVTLLQEELKDLRETIRELAHHRSILGLAYVDA